MIKLIILRLTFVLYIKNIYYIKKLYNYLRIRKTLIGEPNKIAKFQLKNLFNTIFLILETIITIFHKFKY